MKKFKRKTICIIIGTRPELIKQISVYNECIKKIGKQNVLLINSGQHRKFLDFYIKEKKINFDITLKNNESTKSLKRNLLHSIDNFYKIFKKIKPNIVLIQGDTTTAAACAYAASLNGLIVAHNEAGLRTYDIKNPYPEELNRKLITSVSNVHFAPTKLNKENLIKEGINKSNIFVVGNPGIDSFISSLKQKPTSHALDIISMSKKEFKKIVFLTAHRRESVGKSFHNLFKLLKIFFDKNNDLLLVTCNHPNRYALKYFEKYLKNLKNIYISKPFDYLTTCKIIQHSSFVITDSGGIQEECATIGVPTVICRKVTERKEAVRLKIAKLTELNNKKLIPTLDWAKNKKKIKNWREKPYGSGNSAKKITKILLNYL